MTSKEILQKLSEKPENAEDGKSGDKSGSGKTTQKSTDQSESTKQKSQDDLQTEEANAADPAKSTLSSEEAQADEHSYSGEDEEEGGWIEDVTEDGQNDRR